MDFYNGKFVLITGGSSGIGLALAKRLIKENCRIAILSRQQNLLQNAEKEISALAPTGASPIIVVQADVSKREDLNITLNKMVKDHGVPDIVINSAGVTHPGTFTTLKPEIFEWLMNVNYFGTVNVLKFLVPEMKKRRSGVIVNISSMAGFLGIYGYTAYSASKFAITGFTDALRTELKTYNLQVSIVFPPDTQTPQLEYEEPFKPYVTKQVAGSAKLMSPEKVAEEIVKQIFRKKYLILPGFESKMIYFLNNLLGRRFYNVIDLLVKNAIGKLRLG